MKTFISDLHLGDGSKADDFHFDTELHRFLVVYPNTKILGDGHEFWQADWDKIVWAHPAVSQQLLLAISQGNYFYGNHDYLPFAKICPEFYEDDLIFAQHGHQHDVFNKNQNPMQSLKKPKTPIGKYITQVVGWLERLIHPDMDDYLLQLKKKHGDFLWIAAELQNKENELARSQKYNLSSKKITIEGHSHEPDVIKFPTGKIYANCGSWVGSEPTYIQVNDNTVQLRDGLDYRVIKEVKIYE